MIDYEIWFSSLHAFILKPNFGILIMHWPCISSVHPSNSFFSGQCISCPIATIIVTYLRLIGASGSYNCRQFNSTNLEWSVNKLFQNTIFIFVSFFCQFIDTLLKIRVDSLVAYIYSMLIVLLKINDRRDPTMMQFVEGQTVQIVVKSHDKRTLA